MMNLSKLKRNNKRKKKNEFSKVLLIQESVLIWVITLSYIVLAFVCVLLGFTGSLPWLSVIPSLAWATYGVSQGFYYNKSKKENTKDGIKYETVMAQLQNQISAAGPAEESDELDPFGPI